MEPLRRPLRPRNAVPALVLAFSLLGPAAPAALPASGHLSFDVHGEDEGLGSLSPTVLLQDRVGFLWVGTPDGLFRFDGRTFSRFGVRDGLPDARITALHETAKGVLYAGTRSGLARLDGLRFTALGAAAGLPRAVVTSILSDAHGTVFAGTARGLFLSISDRFHLDARTDGFPETGVTALALRPGGGLLVARDGRLFLREGGRQREFGFPAGLPALERIDAVAVDGADRIWVRGPGQLYQLSGDTGWFAPAPLPAGAELGTGTLGLAPGREVAVPTPRGLWVHGGDGFVRLSRQDGLPGEATLSALTDREGSLWVGVNGVGLVRRAGTGAVRHWGATQGLPEGAVFCAARGRAAGGRGPLWVGTSDGVVAIDGAGRVRRVEASGALPEGPILSLAVEADGGLLVAPWTGPLARLSPGGGSARLLGVEGLPAAELQLLSVASLPGGDVWAAARTGVFVLRKGTDRLVKVALPGDGAPEPVHALVLDPSGTLWGAGRGGLLRLTGDVRRFDRDSGLRTTPLVSAAALADGSLLLAGADGLVERVRIEGERAVPVPIEAARPPRRVGAVAAGKDGAIWFGGRGVERLANGSKDLDSLGRADGLPSEEVIPNSLFVDDDGAVLFGTSRGLVRCDPTLLGEPPPPPIVAFTAAWTGTRPLRLDAPATLASSERELRISWAALSFTQAGRTRFRLRVAGLDEASSETAQTEIHLKALPPGRYAVEVSAVAPGAKGAAAASRFVFRVSPKLWQTWWFRLFALAALAGLLVGTARLYSARLLAQVSHLEERLGDQERTIERKERELAEASLTDPGTGIRNRRFFFEAIGADVEKALRAYAPFAPPAQRRNGDVLFYLVDVDHLEKVNEAHGFGTGDEVLAETVRRLKGVVRSSDFLVRWGGGTFLVVSRTGAREKGEVLAGRLLSTISQTPFEASGGLKLSLTASVGWAPYPWLSEAPAEVKYEDVLRLADRAMESAKESGGNLSLGVLAPGDGAEHAGEARRYTSESLLPLDGKSVVLVRTTPDAAVAPA